MLDELAREGARRMIAAALEVEADDYVARYVHEIDADGRRLVVRNGYAHERVLRVGTEAMRLRAPRVNDRRIDAHTGESHRQEPRHAHGPRRRRAPALRRRGVGQRQGHVVRL
jgi:putative transposase